MAAAGAALLLRPRRRCARCFSRRRLPQSCHHRVPAGVQHIALSPQWPSMQHGSMLSGHAVGFEPSHLLYLNDSLFLQLLSPADRHGDSSKN